MKPKKRKKPRRYNWASVRHTAVKADPAGRMADIWSFAERKQAAKFRERVEREKLYGGGMLYGELMTAEMERRVRDSIRVVNVAHVAAGRNRETEALAIKVSDEVAMLRSRGVITFEQEAAAERLRTDFHAAGMAGVFAFDYQHDKVDDAVTTQNHDAEMVNRLDAIDRYIAAIRIIPISCWPVIRDVVLQEIRLDVVRMPNMNSKKLKRLKIITLLQIGLEQLASFYGFKRKARKKHARNLNGSKPSMADFGSSATVEKVSEGS